MFCYKFKNIKLIFIFFPKNACTTIKNYINSIDNITENDTTTNIHCFGKYFNNISIEDILSKYKDCHVIFFKRNPYSRYRSGYSKFTNKLILNLRVDTNKTIEENHKLVNYGNLSIDEWIKVIEKIDPMNLESHFKPQTSIPNIEDILNHPKTKILDISELDNLNNYINNLLSNNNNSVYNIDIREKYNREKDFFCEETKEKIYNYYKKDFLLLGYSK